MVNSKEIIEFAIELALRPEIVKFDSLGKERASGWIFYQDAGYRFSASHCFPEVRSNWLVYFIAPYQPPAELRQLLGWLVNLRCQAKEIETGLESGHLKEIEKVKNWKEIVKALFRRNRKKLFCLIASGVVAPLIFYLRKRLKGGEKHGN